MQRLPLMLQFSYGIRRSMCLLFLYPHLSAPVLNVIKRMTYARDIWEYLDTMYNRVTPMEPVTLEIQL